MFGSIGIPEIIVIVIVIMLLFGPEKLPDFAKTFGKTIRDFRKTLNEAKSTIENELDKASISKEINQLRQDMQSDIGIDSLNETSQEIKAELNTIKNTNFESNNEFNTTETEDVYRKQE